MSDRPAFDPRMPDADLCVLPRVLARLAERRTEDTCAVFDDETIWTYADTLGQSLGVADALAQLGVGRGETVLICLANGPLALKAWFGTNCLGAVSVAINTAYRGAILQPNRMRTGQHMQFGSRARSLWGGRAQIETTPGSQRLLHSFGTPAHRDEHNDFWLGEAAT
jgi:non-ribosomal peptide synthetase component E (peptide arylation enzyme)